MIVWFAFFFLTIIYLTSFKTCLLPPRTAGTQVNVHNLADLPLNQTFFASKNMLLLCCRRGNPESAYFWPSCIVVLCLFILLFQKSASVLASPSTVFFRLGIKTDLDKCQMQFTSLLFLGSSLFHWTVCTMVHLWSCFSAFIIMQCNHVDVGTGAFFIFFSLMQKSSMLCYEECCCKRFEWQYLIYSQSVTSLAVAV